MEPSSIVHHHGFTQHEAEKQPDKMPLSGLAQSRPLGALVARCRVQVSPYRVETPGVRRAETAKRLGSVRSDQASRILARSPVDFCSLVLRD